MFQALVAIGAFWIGASVWLQHDGDPMWVWMSLLPAVWLGTLSLYGE